MATVWIVQDKQRFNKITKKHESIFNYSLAENFGTLKFILSNNDSALAQQPAILKLKRDLFKFKEHDSLLLVGDPALIGAAMTIVSSINRGEVPVLLYEKFTKTYFRKIYKF